MTFLDVPLRVFAACALGAVIGFEREMKHRPAGLRTNMLTSLAACVFTVVTLRLAQDFIHSGGRIRGRTTGADVGSRPRRGLPSAPAISASLPLRRSRRFSASLDLASLRHRLAPNTEQSDSRLSGDL